MEGKEAAQSQRQREHCQGAAGGVCWQRRWGDGKEGRVDRMILRGGAGEATPLPTSAGALPEGQLEPVGEGVEGEGRGEQIDRRSIYYLGERRGGSVAIEGQLGFCSFGRDDRGGDGFV